MITKMDRNNNIIKWLRPMLVCIAVLITFLLTLPTGSYADETAKTVRVGYYENEVFQEGAEEGKVKYTKEISLKKRQVILLSMKTTGCSITL